MINNKSLMNDKLNLYLKEIHKNYNNNKIVIYIEIISRPISLALPVVMPCSAHWSRCVSTSFMTSNSNFAAWKKSARSMDCSIYFQCHLLNWTNSVCIFLTLPHFFGYSNDFFLHLICPSPFHFTFGLSCFERVFFCYFKPNIQHELVRLQVFRPFIIRLP